MLNKPKTRAEAEKVTYGHFRPRKYDPKFCVYQVWESGRAPNDYQCKRAPGFGPDKLYCKQHARKVAGAAEGDEIAERFIFSCEYGYSIFKATGRVTSGGAFIAADKERLIGKGSLPYGVIKRGIYLTLREAIRAALNWHSEQAANAEQKAREYRATAAELSALLAQPAPAPEQAAPDLEHIPHNCDGRECSCHNGVLTPDQLQQPEQAAPVGDRHE